MQMNFIRLLTTASAACFASLSIPVHAGEYQGTCFFNAKKMPCSVSQNPYTMTMRWADGVTEAYSHQGNGVFIDERGGVWQSNLNAPRGIWLEHANGNSIGFVED